MARIALIGPGAVGGLITVLLSETERHAITVCARRVISDITLRTERGLLIAHPRVITQPFDAGATDWALVATKAYDVPGAAAWLPPLGDDCKVAVLQNGIEHRERFAPYLPLSRIVPVMVDCPAERTGAGELWQRAPAKLAVADDKNGREFAALFTGTAVSVTLVQDFQTAIWRKLCVNVIGAISALLLQPAGIMRDEQLGELARAMLRECIAVGRAEGAALDESVIEPVLNQYRQAPPDAVNSLHADRLAGRRMEVDARNGVVVRLGRKHGIPTPLNAMTVALLSAGGLV